MAYHRLYADPEEPEDRKLIELFKKSGVYGCVIPERRHADYPELIRESPMLGIYGICKVREYLTGMLRNKPR